MHLYTEVAAEYERRISQLETEAADAEAEVDDMREELRRVLRREEAAAVNELDARSSKAGLERAREIAETATAVERRAKEEAQVEAQVGMRNRL